MTGYGKTALLMAAPRRIEALARGLDNPAAERNPGVAHMFFINPLPAHARDRSCATHPATASRGARGDGGAGPGGAGEFGAGEGRGRCPLLACGQFTPGIFAPR